jgi:hypothetical protein
MPISEGGRFSPVDRIVSPGVFTRENDLSGLAQGVADIGAVIVAPFPKGPGFTPTLVESVTDLEERFGVADGVLYGPYTAKEYLREKGFVTVCRVGALTGYHQKFPFVLYAIKGQWNRVADAGWTATTSSYISVGSTLAAYVTYSVVAEATVTPTSSIQSGSLTFTSTAFTVVFRGTTGVGTPTGQHSTGSTLYAGQTVSMGTLSFTVPIVGVYAIPTGSASGSVAQAIFNSGLFVTSSISISGAASPFNTATIQNFTMSAIPNSCGGYIYSVEGLISGSFGVYDGTFTTAGSTTFDACSGSWSGSADYRILAVLADTQNASINTSLQAPGFSGSSLVRASVVSGSSSIPTEFNLSMSATNSSTPYGVYNFSLDEGSTKYITSVFGSDAIAGDPDTYVAGTKKEAGYLYSIFENTIARVVSEPSKWFISGSVLPDSTFSGEPLNFTDDYSLDLTNGDSQYSLTNASTPWIVSQKISPWNGGTPTRFNLFKLHTLSDGTNTNTAYKIEISNVKLAGTVAGSDWGTFTLTIRSYSDTDKRPKILQQFNNLNLDPNSSNFIGRRIGDRYNYIDFNGKILEFGTYDNNSKYVRVEVSDVPWPTAAVPYGFAAYATPINSAAGYWCPAMTFTKASVYGRQPGKFPSGINFDDAPTGADSELSALYPTASTGIGTSDDNKQYFAPLPEFGAYSSVGRNSIFALDSEISNGGVSTGSAFTGSNIVPAVYDASQETTYVKMRKFVFGFQGGFDGQSPAIPLNVGGDITAGNTQGLDCTNINSAGSIAYKQCVGALGNADEFDINMIVTPGIIHEHHTYVTNLIVDMCEARGDCFYILDLYVDDGNPSSGQIQQVLSLADEFDTSYAGAYYPWVRIKDTNTNQLITVPPSVVLPAVYAANDRVAGEWWAVAGLNRGGIPNAKMVTDRTTHAERDDLYEGRVNPIAAFPGQGIVVWGQKTLQVKSSALDRINVRRLLIEIKKFFASSARYLVFEQNTAATRNKFLGIVNPYLQSIQQRSGLYAFEVVMDESNNTPDLIDANILYGQIYLKPTKTAEFIVFDFNIVPTSGAMFGPNA